MIVEFFILTSGRKKNLIISLHFFFIYSTDWHLHLSFEMTTEINSGNRIYNFGSLDVFINQYAPQKISNYIK